MAISKEIKDLVEATVEGVVKVVLPSSQKPSKEVLRVAIEEQRREYDHLTEAYNRVSTKILTLAGGGFALLTFLYANPADKTNPLFIPATLYGKIFYYVGFVLTVGALSALLYAVKPKGQWKTPPEVGELSELKEINETEYLEYIKNRYLDCFRANVNTYHDKHKFLNLSFYPLIFGAIILVVLKIFRAA